MAPPCIPTIYEGDNGGTTSRGVNVAEVRVAFPVPEVTPFFTTAINALVEHFNQRFELYGRRIVPVFVPGAADAVLQARARAAEAGAQNVFAAVTGAVEWLWAQPALPVELARQDIITVVRGGSTWWTDRTLYDAYDPYVWSVYPSSEDIQANIGDFACIALAGHPAARAGDANLVGRTRRFGIVALGHEQAPAVTTLKQLLTDCTGQTPLQLDWKTKDGTTALRTGLERMKSGSTDGATTLVCVCEAGYGSDAISESHTANLHPEWLLAPSFWASGNDEEWVQPHRAAGRMAPPIRVGAGPRLLPLQARPWFHAVSPALARAASGDVHGIVSMAEFLYPELLLLATGIQGAGPNLTPSSFQQALLTTQFANVGAGQPPYWQPSAGFGAGDHSLYDDYNVGWWSDQAVAVDQLVGSREQGSWCYLDQAARFRPGTYPTAAEQRMFTEAVQCR